MLRMVLFLTLVGCPGTTVPDSETDLVDTDTDTDSDTDTDTDSDTEKEWEPAMGCDGSIPLTRDSEWVVQSNASWDSCRTSADCLAVDARCDDCCDYVGVCADQRSAFMVSKGSLCAGYDGGVCDCAPHSTTPRCDAGRCVVDVVYE